MSEEINELLVKDIGRKCGEDVGCAIRRNMQLVDLPRERMMVAIYGAGVAVGNATGAWLAAMGLPCEPVEADIDQMWRDVLRPLALGQLGEHTARAG